MRPILITLSCCAVLLMACRDKSPYSAMRKKRVNIDTIIKHIPYNWAARIQLQLNRWVEFYQAQDPGFSISKFIAEDHAVKAFQDAPGTSPLNDPRSRFYCFSPDSSRYIDLDWGLGITAGSGGSLTAHPDLHWGIFLVDKRTETSAQIDVTNSSHAVQDAAWLDSSTVVLASLERGTKYQYDKLLLTVIDIHTHTYRYYVMDRMYFHPESPRFKGNYDMDVRLKSVRFENDQR